MKIEKKDLQNIIQDIVANGVFKGEEVDITTIKIIKSIWPIIEYLKRPSSGLDKGT